MDIRSPVENQDQYARKRIRVTQACNHCRSRKSKCDGRRPSCATCVSLGAECDYAANGRKRGHPAGRLHYLTNHLNASEALLGALVVANPGLQTIICAEMQNLSLVSCDELQRSRTLWKRSAGYLPLKQLIGRLNDRGSLSYLANEDLTISDEPSQKPGSLEIASLTPPASGEELTSIKRNETTMRAGVVEYSPWYERGLGSSSTFMPVTSPCSDTRESEQLGNILAGPSTTKSTHDAGHGSDWAPVATITNEDPSILCLYRILITSHAGARTFKIPPDDSKALSHFFLHMNSILPMMDKITLLKLLHRRHSRPDATSKGASCDEEDTIVLLSYALSTNTRKGHAVESSFSPEPMHADVFLHTLELMATDSWPRQPGPEHMQILLLFALLLMQKRCWSSSRQVISIACDWALRVKCDDNPLAYEPLLRTTVEGNQKIWLACFTLDTLSAAKLNTLPTMRAYELRHIFIQEDTLEEWDNWVCGNPNVAQMSPGRIISVSKEFLKLMRIINESLSALNSCNRDSYSTSNNKGSREELHIFRTALESAQQWRLELPVHIVPYLISGNGDPRLNQSTEILPSYILNLNLVFLALVCWSYRGILGLQPAYTVDPFRCSSIDMTDMRAFVETLGTITTLAELFQRTYMSNFSHPYLEILLFMAKPAMTAARRNITTITIQYQQALANLSVRMESLQAENFSNTNGVPMNREDSSSMSKELGRNLELPNPNSTIASSDAERTSQHEHTSVTAELHELLTHSTGSETIPMYNGGGECTLRESDVFRHPYQFFPPHDPANLLDFIQKLGYVQQGIDDGRISGNGANDGVVHDAGTNRSERSKDKTAKEATKDGTGADQDPTASFIVPDLEHILDEWIAEASNF